MMLRHDDPAAAVSHLQPDDWAHANRLLVRKAIAEFSHELLLRPRPSGPAARAAWQRYELDDPTGRVRHAFDAQPMALRHWRIDPASIVRTVDGMPQPLDAQRFVVEFKEPLGLRAEMLPVYLEEIGSTLFGAAYKRARRSPPSAALVDADFQTLEHSMTEGHPGFVANNGRIGFDAADYPAYAPEAGRPFSIVWIAVHKSCASFACAADLSYERLLDEEVGAAGIQRFVHTLLQAGVPPDDYLVMPVHPWQWFNRLAIGFAGEIAERRIVCLGRGGDLYQAQQSIRTYFNVSQPHKRYVKTSLSILNMGFMRGLSPYYMSGTPAINDWVHALVDADATLRAHGFGILREVAAIGYRHAQLESAIEGDSPRKKMLSALWRESPLARIAPHERLMTMTALLHVDRDGQALLPALIRRSGRSVQAWLQCYLRAYLAPLLHCFYAHDLVFMPHGENLILVLEGHVPVRVLMKDVAEECAILDKDMRPALPERVQRIAVDVPDDYKLLGIFIDVFDGFFRHMSQVLVDAGCCSEDTFWAEVAACALRYQQEHPRLGAKFEAHDLFCNEFRHSCLNRLQLGNNAQMVNLADPAAGLKMAGCLPNPLAKFRPSRAPRGSVPPRRAAAG
jgi:siderophore synthetase component